MNFRFLFILFLSYKALSQSFDDFKILSRIDSNSIYLVIHNTIPSSMTLKISDKTTGKITQKFIIPAQDSLMILKREAINSEAYLKEINNKYAFKYSFGDSLTSKHNDRYLYELPFKENKRYEVIQSWGGKFSHSEAKSFHALDFKMKIGQPVHAARPGIVVRSIDKFTKNGGEELQNYAHVIVIKHEDNTFAHYVHLKPQGSLVEIGQKIEKGQLIGLSGNTGFSTQPHLHFVVRDGTGNSVPIYFEAFGNKTLQTGRKYKR